jgi:hypothetical protein
MTPKVQYNANDELWYQFLTCIHKSVTTQRHFLKPLFCFIQKGGPGAVVRVVFVSLSHHVMGSRDPLRICEGRLASVYPFPRPY